MIRKVQSQSDPDRIRPPQTHVCGAPNQTDSRNGLLDRVEFYAAAAVVFFSPINLLRLPFFYFTLSDGFACISLMLLLITGRLNLLPIGRVWTVMWMSGLATLLAMLLFSSLLHADPMRGLVYALQYFFAYGVILVILGGRSERELHLFAKAYVLCIILMCLYGIYLINIDDQRNTAFVTGSGRFTGFVERENECAALIALTSPLLMLLVAVRQWPKVALLGVAIMAYGVMLTGSNTGLGSFALVVSIFALIIADWKVLVPAGASCS